MLESPAMLCSSLFMMVGTTQSAAKSGKVSFRETSWRLALFYRAATSLNWNLPTPSYAPRPQCVPHCSQVDFLKQT